MAHASTILPTGVPHLDVVLGGGLVRTSTVLIVSESGGGKTVLGSQIAAAAAQRNEPVVLVTAFGEAHNKRIANLERFMFFDRTQVGARIRLINMEHQLRASFDDAAATIVREARDGRARLVVLDSLDGVRMCSDTADAMYYFVHDLGAKLHLLGVTLLLLGAIDTHPPVPEGDYTLADTVIELHADATSSRRTLQVRKHQGMAPLLGTHTFTIGAAGVECWERFDLLPPPAVSALSNERVSTGLPPLDELLHGGVPRGSITLLSGATGTGKTTLALQTALAQAAHGAPTLFVTLGVPAQALLAGAQRWGVDPASLLALQIEEHPLATLDPDIMAHRLWARSIEHPGSVVVLDGAQQLTARLGSERSVSFWESLFVHLRARHITTWVLDDDRWTTEGMNGQHHMLRTLADNVVNVHRSATVPSSVMLRVVKMRSSDHAHAPQPYTIGDHGIEFQFPEQAAPGD